MDQTQIDQELLIRVGYKNDEHTISWDVLKSLGDSLEALVQSVAKYNEQFAGKVNLENFKLDFSGFYDGSAVPAFRIAPQIQSSIFNDRHITKSIASEFDNLLQNIDKGNYQEISDRYKTDEAKNDIIKKVYDFTNSAGTIPVSIVKRSSKKDNKFTDVYKIRKLNKSIMDKLIIIDRDLDVADTMSSEITAFAKVRIKSRNGKTTKKTSELYQDKEATLSLKYDEIIVNDKIYELNFPIFFQLIKEGKGTILEQEQLDLFAAGLTLEQAKESLLDQFDHTYNRLNELSANQLSDHLKKVKSFYNLLVKQISN